MRQVKIGKILLTSGGKWTAGVAYPALTYVTHNGDGWWSKIETLNSEPSDENNMWIKATDVGDYIKQLVSVTDDASAQMQAILEAETKRVEAENERITAEQQRQKDEKARQDAETIRQEEETQRQKDEQSRRNAENERDQSYADAEERRDELFVQREEQRQNAYEIAEQARQDKEAIRERQEATRVSQEEQRQSAFEVAMRNADTATTLATETAEHPTKPGDDFYMYVWDPGTKSYSKTNIFIKGEGFSIYKTYETIALMEADTTNVPDGRFVLISNNNVDDPDNAKLYVKDSGVFRFLVDLSGAVGFSGKTPQLEIGTVTNGGNMGAASASIVRTGTDADGNPTYSINLALPMVSYDDLTEAQKKELQKPATDMIVTLEATNEAVKTEEAKRVEAEAGRVAEWNTIKTKAASATSAANDAATLANSKATLADTAASNANEKASMADTAASNANEKASMADTAASNANEKAGYAQTQGNYAKEQGDALVNFTETVERSKSTEASLNSLIKNMEEQGHVHAQSLDVDAIPTICGFPLIKIRDEDPNVTPDFIGQFWINKSGNTVYIATHCNSAAGYKAI